MQRERQRVFRRELVAGFQPDAVAHACGLQPLDDANADAVVLAADVADVVDQQPRGGDVLECHVDDRTTSCTSSPRLFSTRTCKGILPRACVAQLRHGS